MSFAAELFILETQDPRKVELYSLEKWVYSDLFDMPQLFGLIGSNSMRENWKICIGI